MNALNIIKDIKYRDLPIGKMIIYSLKSTQNNVHFYYNENNNEIFFSNTNGLCHNLIVLSYLLMLLETRDIIPYKINFSLQEFRNQDISSFFKKTHNVLLDKQECLEGCADILVKDKTKANLLYNVTKNFNLINNFNDDLNDKFFYQKTLFFLNLKKIFKKHFYFSNDIKKHLDLSFNTTFLKIRRTDYIFPKNSNEITRLYKFINNKQVYVYTEDKDIYEKIKDSGYRGKLSLPRDNPINLKEYFYFLYFSSKCNQLICTSSAFSLLAIALRESLDTIIYSFKTNKIIYSN